MLYALRLERDVGNANEWMDEGEWAKLGERLATDLGIDLFMNDDDKRRRRPARWGATAHFP